MEPVSKINKWGDLNKRGGRKFCQNLINGDTLIRLLRVEKNPEIDERSCLFIRDLRVHQHPGVLSHFKRKSV